MVILLNCCSSEDWKHSSQGYLMSLRCFVNTERCLWHVCSLFVFSLLWRLRHMVVNTWCSSWISLPRRYPYYLQCFWRRQLSAGSMVSMISVTQVKFDIRCYKNLVTITTNYMYFQPTLFTYVTSLKQKMNYCIRTTLFPSWSPSCLVFKVGRVILSRVQHKPQYSKRALYSCWRPS